MPALLRNSGADVTDMVKKAGKRPMVEANGVEMEDLQPKGKKGKPAAANAGGKRKAPAKEEPEPVSITGETLSN